ncbi:MAG: SDR family NAD(P)-dependent oxidoreductase [Alphaproteobacteria bacterium]|nr:SDR family NAD(P)-dependent oxidoreductase [Alphaproteobacteria bacterium]
MKALVTGASGFVGAAIARRLLAAGHAVRALVRDQSPRDQLADHRVETVVGDLLDHASLATAVRGCDALFHCAADYRIWVPDPDRMYRINVEGTVALMRAALDAGVGRVVYTSSVATLATAVEGGQGDESRPASAQDSIGPYKRSKLRAEIEVARLVAEAGLPAIIVNPSTPMGPGDVKPTPTGRLIVEAAAGRMPAYVNTGLNIVHVDDVATGHLLAYEKGTIGERYVLGGDDLWLSDILAEIAGLYGRRPPRLRLPHGAVMPLAVMAEAWARLSGREPFVTVDGLRMARKLMFYSSEKARRDLGYAPRPGREAIRDAVEDFRRRGLCP